MHTLKKLSDVLAKPVVMNITLPVLMIYLVIGTVAQKYIGLYEATKIFFSSWILWAGPVPLPGLPILLGVLLANLTFKLIFKSPWNIQNSGIIMTHMGAFLLLLGGLFTMLFSHEGYVDLAEGGKKAYVSDFHKREVALLNKHGEVVASLPHKTLEVGDLIRVPGSDILVEVLHSCRNCEIQERMPLQRIYHGMAAHMQLHDAPLRLEDEENLAGVTVSVNSGDSEGIHLALEHVPQWPEIRAGEETYQLVLRRAQRDLPFQIELLDFEKELYPGTNIAKSYSSRIRIIDGGAQWESLIRMNEPLRYKGYTLFQSSYLETPEGDVSVLAVVWNAGRSFPYISGLALCFGILIHLFVRRRGKAKLRQAQQEKQKDKPAHAV